MSISPLPPKQIGYRLIREGRGGTFIFDPKDTDILNWNQLGHIGTHVHGTGVGVYFKIDSHTAFCAHLKVDNGVKYPENVTAYNERDALTMMVFHKLAAHAEAKAWDVKNPCFGQNLIFVGPNVEYVAADGKIYSRTGRCVHHAVRMFFSYAKQGIEIEAMQRQNDANDSREEAMEAERADESSGSLVLLNRAQVLEHEARSLLQKGDALEKRIQYSNNPRTCHGFIADYYAGEAQLLRTTELPAKEGDVMRFEVPSLITVIPGELRDYMRVDEHGLKLGEWDFRVDAKDSAHSLVLADWLENQELESPFRTVNFN